MILDRSLDVDGSLHQFLLTKCDGGLALTKSPPARLVLVGETACRKSFSATELTTITFFNKTITKHVEKIQTNGLGLNSCLCEHTRSRLASWA